MSDLMASTVPTKKQNIPEINLYSLKFIVNKVIRYKYYLLYYKYMKKTVFEKIVEGTLPSNKIYSDKNTYVFLADPARTSGHTLVITKKPYKDILDIPENRVIDLIKTIKKIAPAVMAATKAGGINIIQNTREAAGQEVFHIHFHIIPRHKNDEISAKNLDTFKYNNNEAKTIAEEIKAKII